MPWASLVKKKNLSAMQETWVQSLGRGGAQLVQLNVVFLALGLIMVV